MGVFPALILRHLVDSSKSSLRSRNHSKLWEANDLESFFTALGLWFQAFVTKSKQAKRSGGIRNVSLPKLPAFHLPFPSGSFCHSDLQSPSPPGWPQPPVWAEDLPSCPSSTILSASPQQSQSKTPPKFIARTAKQLYPSPCQATSLLYPCLPLPPSPK